MPKSNKKKISISFCEKYSGIYDFLKTKDNISSYICELIKKDIEAPSEDIVLEAKIEKVLEKLLKDKKFIIDNQSEENEVDIQTPSSEDVNTILDIF